MLLPSEEEGMIKQLEAKKIPITNIKYVHVPQNMLILWN